MKLVVIGLGQCGGRIADYFVRLNRKAQVLRGTEVITGAYAVNTDMADLSGLRRVRADYQHRILIGGRKTGGHGVGKINELAAELAREDADKVIDSLRTAEHFAETDAFLLIAGAAGGTGSGSVAVMSQHVKERYVDKPVYNMIILPFEHEEMTEERTVYNAATCLKSSYLVADAVFLVDNQRYIRKDESAEQNLSQINTMIVEPFYDLLCAGEEKNPRYIGAKMLDAGDIIQTLTGWTTIGYGKSPVRIVRSLFERAQHFRSKVVETQKGVHAMDQALSGLSIRCKPVEARRALYLVTAPSSEINMDVIKELGAHLKSVAPEAIIRSGDYPREKTGLEVALVLSELSDVEKVRNYFTKTINLLANLKKREKIDRFRGIESSFSDIPSLL